MHERPRLASFAAAAMATAAAVPALGDSNAALLVPAGASMVLTVQLTITTALGTSSDSDTKTLTVVGNGQAFLGGPDRAWTAATMNQMHIDPSDATFHFDLYCFPFIGCQSLDVALTNLVIDLTAPSTSAIATGGAASFVNAPVAIQGNYNATGVATASGALLNNTTSTIGCRILAQPGGTVRFDQLSMSPVTTVVDPATLPAGVTALTITITPNLANTTMSGPWIHVNPYDLNGDGSVGAADLTILLNQWGGPGSADFNGSGAVDAADIAVLLSNWG